MIIVERFTHSVLAVVAYKRAESVECIKRHIDVARGMPVSVSRGRIVVCGLRSGGHTVNRSDYGLVAL